MDHQAFAQLLGNYGEFVGAIAVVVTLFYLARQIRFLGRAQTIATQHEILTEFRRSQELVIEHSELQDALTRLVQNQPVPQGSRGQLEHYVSNVFRIYEEAYLAHLNGSLDNTFWQSRRVVLKDTLLSKTFVHGWWQSWGKSAGYSAPFVELVEEMIADLNA